VHNISPHVTIVISSATLSVLQGPKGELQRSLPNLVTVEKVDGNIISVKRVNETRQANQLHGLARTLVSNMVVGVSDGFTKTLSMIGVGYRAAVNGNNLTLSLGYSHPVEMPVPKGLEVTVEKNTTILVSGFDRNWSDSSLQISGLSANPNLIRAREYAMQTSMYAARKASAESKCI